MKTHCKGYSRDIALGDLPPIRPSAMKIMCIITVFMMLSSVSYAEVVGCTTNVNGKSKQLRYNIFGDKLNDNYSMREIFFGGWGNIDCPSYITLRHLTPGLTDSERSVFCLQFDKKLKTYTGYVNGPRDAYLNCSKPSKTFCERVNDSKAAAIAITGLGTGAVAGASTGAAAAGVTAVAHSSGAVILTGSAGYISGTLGTIGAGSLAVLTAPAAITTAAVSVVAVGGAVYFCGENNISPHEGKKSKLKKGQENRTKNNGVTPNI